MENCNKNVLHKTKRVRSERKITQTLHSVSSYAYILRVGETICIYAGKCVDFSNSKHISNGSPRHYQPIIIAIPLSTIEYIYWIPKFIIIIVIRWEGVRDWEREVQSLAIMTNVLVPQTIPRSHILCNINRCSHTMSNTCKINSI